MSRGTGMSMCYIWMPQVLEGKICTIWYIPDVRIIYITLKIEPAIYEGSGIDIEVGVKDTLLSPHVAYN